MAIMRCDCKNEGQDALNGKGMRVHNKTSKERTYRCTVCKSEKQKAG